MVSSRDWQRDRHAFSVIFHIQPRFQAVIEANSGSIYNKFHKTKVHGNIQGSNITSTSTI